MNKIKSITTALMTFSILFATSFTSSAMDSYIEQSLIDVCKAAKSNSIAKYNKTTHSYHLKDRTIAMKVMCNGDDIADFARKYGSYKVANKLEKSIQGNVSITDVAAVSKINVKFNDLSE